MHGTGDSLTGETHGRVKSMTETHGSVFGFMALLTPGIFESPALRESSARKSPLHKPL